MKYPFFLISLSFILLTASISRASDGEDAPVSEKKVQIEDIPKLKKDHLSPEELLAYLQGRLLLLKEKIKGFDQIRHRDGLGSQTEMAQLSLENAKEDFARISYRSTIRNLNNFLNWTQSPKIKDYLKAQFMLGKSYNKLGNPHKAIRAFSRYLATLATNQEHFTREAIEVIADLLKLVEKHKHRHGLELGQLMAVLTSLSVPEQQKSWILFYAGKSARIVGNSKVALYWLERAIKKTKSTRLKARARYNRGLVHLHQKQYNQAIKDFEYALAESDDGAFDYKEWARISLARVYVHLKKPNTALSHYEEVSEQSQPYSEALFEKIYIHLALDKPKEAIIAATEYLIRFSHKNNAYQIRTIKAYLDLSAEDLKNAKSTIDIGNDRLKAISQWLRDNYSDRTTLTHLDIKGIMRVTQPEISQPPQVEYGRKLFRRLEALSRRISYLRNDLRNTIFTLGRINSNQLKPDWQRRMTQLKILLTLLLETGDALAQAEHGLYQSRLTEKDKYILKSAHLRRQRGLSAPASFNRGRGPWKDWGKLGEYTLRAAKRFRQIKSLQATLANLTLLTSTVDVRRPDARKSEIIELQTQTNIMESELLRAIEIIRSRQALTSIAMSGILPLKMLLKDQAQNLFTEMSILSEYRNQFLTPQQEHISSDLRENWDLWQYLLESIFEQIVLLEKDMRDTIVHRLDALRGPKQKNQQKSPKLSDDSRLSDFELRGSKHP